MGADVVVLGRRRPAVGHDGAFVQCDLLDGADLQSAFEAAKADCLLHLAWFTEHGAFWASPLNLDWVTATYRLVDAFCRAGGRQVVVAGTCAEYDWSQGYCVEDSTPTRPDSLYGTAKDAARRLVMAICEARGVRCAWGRVFMPYGPGEDGRRVVPRLIGVFRDGRPAFGVSAGAYRDLLHVSDAASAFVTLLSREGSGVFNISSGRPVSMADVVRAVAARYDGDPNRVLALAPERPAWSSGNPELLVGSSAKLRALGWQDEIQDIRIY